MSYDVIEISDRNGFERLKEEWNDLLSKSSCNLSFLRHEWFLNWWNHFGGSNCLSIIIVRRDGALAGIFPLMEVNKIFAGAPFVILQSMTNFHSPRFHFIVKSGKEDVLLAFWQYLRRRPRRWDLLQLQNMPSDIPGYAALLRIAREDRHHAELWHGQASPYLNIKGSWDEYQGILKPKFRSNMRNRMKRLHQLGKIEYEIVTEPSWVNGALTDGFAIEQKGWKGGKGSAILCNPLLVNFYLQWANIAASNGWLRLSFLKINGRRVAFDYSFIYQNNLYCMKIGYDPEFRPYSVGQILCSEIIRSCFERKIKEYNFLGEATTQKLDWNPLIRPHVWLYLYSRNLPSYVHYLYKFGFSQLKMQLKKQ